MHHIAAFVKAGIGCLDLVKIGTAVFDTNSFFQGKKQATYVKQVPLGPDAFGGLYNEVILFVNDDVRKQFETNLRAQKAQGAVDVKYSDYPSRTSVAEYTGDGKLYIWVSPKYVLREVSGTDVCDRPIVLPNGKTLDVAMSHMYFVGNQRNVHKVIQQYRYEKRMSRERGIYNDPTLGNWQGLRLDQWENISLKMAYNTELYIWCKSGGVLRVTRNKMEWLAPGKAPSGRDATTMICRGYTRHRIPVHCNLYNPGVPAKYPSEFAKSVMSTAAVTSYDLG